MYIVSYRDIDHVYTICIIYNIMNFNITCGIINWIKFIILHEIHLSIWLTHKMDDPKKCIKNIPNKKCILVIKLKIKLGN